MRRRGRILILLGLILGLVAFGLAYFQLQPPEELVARPPQQTTQVLVATQNIPERTQVFVEAVRTEERPVDQVPANALTNPAQVQGTWTLFPIFQGQVIVSDMLVDRARVVEEGLYASFAIPAGKVAFAFPVDDFNSVAGAIQAGDFVDIMVTIRFRVLEEAFVQGTLTRTELGEALVAQLTLQDVEVLKVGLWGAPPAPPAEGQEQAPAPTQNFLTVLLNQQDALALKYFRDDPSFKVDFALRGIGDHTVVTTEAVTLDYLLDRFVIVEPSTLPRVIVTP